MTLIIIDSRRPCQPTIIPGQTREELREEARRLDTLNKRSV